MKKYFKWIICFIFLAIFIFLGILVLTKNDIYIDSIVYNFISKYISNNLTIIFKLLTNIASILIVILVIIFTFLFFKNKKYGIFMSLNLLIITIFQFILKAIFSRTRPVDINLIEENGYSYPSGHSLTAMALYGFIIYLIFKSDLNKRSKLIYITLFSLLIFIVGLSRIYLGVHFFTDVVGAFSFGLAYLIVYINIIKGKLR